MSKPEIILIGAGGHARACIDVIEQQGYFQIAGLVDRPEQRNTRCLGYSVIGADTDLSELIQHYSHALITVGQIETAEHRIRLYQQAAQHRFHLPAIISSFAYVSRHANIGEGTVVMHGAIVNAAARVGKNCIVNNQALVEHDVNIDDHCHISTGAVLNGAVSIGAGSFVGSGSVIKEGVTIGKGCLVGMGLTVRQNLSDDTYFTGHDKI